MSGASLIRLLRALVLTTFLLWAAPARATTVAIVGPPTPSAEVAQVLTILRGELLSLGIAITMSDGMAEQDETTSSEAWLETFAANGANAVIRAIGDDRLAAIDIWLVKSAPRRFEVSRVAVDTGLARQPETLVFRAVEALRAGLLQIDWAARKKREEPIAKPPVTIVPSEETHARGKHDERIGIDLGATAVMSLDGLGPAVLPTLNLGWLAAPSLVIHASAAGLGCRSTVTSTAGSAEVAQQYALVGARYRLRPARRLWPFLGAAAGALRTRVEGQSGPGTTGQDLVQWSALLDMNAGAGLGLHGNIYVTVAAHVQFADPYVRVHIADGVAATSGRPNLLLTLTVGAWL